jgi:hypothetical protein
VKLPKIIAFGHQKFTGKDTLIRFCIDVLRPRSKGLKIIRRSFADCLYDVCYMMYNWAGFQPRAYYLDHPYAKNNILKNGKTVREILIEIGTPVMRAYDDNVWINACLMQNNYDVLFIGDLRFPNEFAAVRNLEGTLIRVTRPGLEVPTDIADTALNGWEDAWDETVENNDCLNKLHKEAERIVNRYILETL